VCTSRRGVNENIRAFTSQVNRVVLSEGCEFFADELGRIRRARPERLLISWVFADQESGTDDASTHQEVSRMKFNRKLIMSLLGGAMLALPMSAPSFAQQAYNADSNHIEQVDWWWDHYKGDRDAYANHGWHRGYYEYSGKRYACDRARGLQTQVWQDRNTGHPAAAQDVAAEAAAARERCYSRN
jgi:hypothetical protein